LACGCTNWFVCGQFVPPPTRRETYVPPPLEAVPVKFRKTVARFRDEGVCTLEKALSLEQVSELIFLLFFLIKFLSQQIVWQVRMCRREVYRMFNTTMSTIQRLGLQEVGAGFFVLYVQ
jgi:hypothetical protein